MNAQTRSILRGAHFVGKVFNLKKKMMLNYFAMFFQLYYVSSIKWYAVIIVFKSFSRILQNKKICDYVNKCLIVTLLS